MAVLKTTLELSWLITSAAKLRLALFDSQLICWRLRQVNIDVLHMQLFFNLHPDSGHSLIGTHFFELVCRSVRYIRTGSCECVS